MRAYVCVRFMEKMKLPFFELVPTAAVIYKKRLNDHRVKLAMSRDSATCAYCGEPSALLFACGCCGKDRRDALYCSRQCQENAWHVHRLSCAGRSALSKTSASAAVGQQMAEVTLPLTDGELSFMIMEPTPTNGTRDNAPVTQSLKDVVSWSYLVVSDIGGRPYQQDAARVMEVRSSPDPRDTVLFAAVCDGHGGGSQTTGVDGGTASKTAIDTIFGLPKQMLQDGTKLGTTPAALSRYFAKAARTAHERISSVAFSSNLNSDSGTTMCAAAIPKVADKAKVMISNIGDSQALLLSATFEGKMITAKHVFPDPTSPDIRRDSCGITQKLATAEPGEQEGYFGHLTGKATGLMMTRAVGHTYLANNCGLLPRPTAYEADIADGDLLLIASDGFWDFFNRSDIITERHAELVSFLKTNDISGAVARAISPGNWDNTTVIAVKFYVTRMVMM